MAVTSAIAAVVSAGTAVYSATRPVPKPPAPPQMKKTPGISSIRQQNTPNNLAAMAAMSKAGGGTLLDSGASAGGSTLTG
jgi:hypothetical protein